MEQMWFCGVHTDVGGGYPETGLSDIALHWLLDHAISHGLLLYKDKYGKIDDIITFKGNPDGPIHDPFDGWWQSLVFKRKNRSWPAKDANGVDRGDPNLHPSVKQRTHGPDNDPDGPYDPWIL